MTQAAPIGKVKAILGKAIPGIRFTSDIRTRAEQDALVAAGKTRARNSQHISGTALDIVLPKGVSTEAVRSTLRDNGIDPSEFLNETGKGQNQGTGAHLHVGWGSKGGDPRSSGGGGSTYDRVTANQRDTGPSLQKVYEAYRTGKMAPQDAAQFEHDVNTGAIMLPRDGTLRKSPPVFQLPAGVIKAYNSREMSDEDRAAIDEDLQDGVVALPRGAKLQAPKPLSMAQSFGMGVRGVATGLAGLGDVISSPVRAIAAAAGVPDVNPNGLRDLANAGADALGLESPQSDSEQLANAIVEGGTQGLATAGLAVPLAGATGATGTVAKALAANPILDTVSGATSGASSEVARQAGAGPVGQLAAGLVGGGATVASAAGVERTLARIGRNAGKDISEIAAAAPKEAVIEPNGDLTPDGREFAAQNGFTPDEVRAAYGEAPPNVRPANDGAPVEVAKAANDSETVSPSPAVNDALPIERVETAPPMRADPEAQPLETASPAAEPTLPATAKARVEEAASESIPLTRGQATQDFATQDAEQTLLAQQSAEGEKARAFRVQQSDAIKEATKTFQEAFGDASSNATDRGEIVQSAVRELRDLGAQGVSALYKEAEKLGGEGLGLITDDIKRVATDVLIDEGVPESVKRSISQQLARYGLVGKPEKMNEVGITKVALDDGSTVSFRGEAEPLTVANAEQLRKAVNDLYLSDPTHRSQALKPVIDDAVEEAIKAAADNPALQVSGVAEAYKTARAAHREQKQTFAAKDVIQQIADFKKGTGTDVLKAENIIKTVMGTGPEALTNLRKIKNILLSKPTTQSKAAWQAIKAHGIAEIFGKSVVENANLGNRSISAISGAKLATALQKFGIDKLKILLDPEEFSQLMKLKNIIRNVTVPITGTTNPSGSAYKLMKFITPMVGRLSGIPFVGQGVEIASNLARQAKEVTQAKQTLKGVTEYTVENAADDMAKSPDISAGIISEADQKAREFLKSFIEIAGSERLIAPIIAAGSQDRGQE